MIGLDLKMEAREWLGEVRKMRMSREFSLDFGLSMLEMDSTEIVQSQTESLPDEECYMATDMLANSTCLR